MKKPCNKHVFFYNKRGERQREKKRGHEGGTEGVCRQYGERTCKELQMVKSQAKTAVFSLTANKPKIQVIPSRGSRMIVAFRMALSNLLL